MLGVVLDLGAQPLHVDVDEPRVRGVAVAPVIVPAIARRPLPYHPVLWVAAGLLHLGLLVRVLAGAREAEGLWRWGGTVGVVAVLVLLGTVVAQLVTGRRGPVRVGVAAP